LRLALLGLAALLVGQLLLVAFLFVG